MTEAELVSEQPAERIYPIRSGRNAHRYRDMSACESMKQSGTAQGKMILCPASLDVKSLRRRAFCCQAYLSEDLWDLHLGIHFIISPLND